MATLKMNIVANKSVSNTKRIMDPFMVHDVMLKEAKMNEFKSEKTGETFTTFRLVYENDKEEIFEETIWQPKQSDGVRPEAIYPQPSNFESLQFELGHILMTFAKDKIEAFNKFAETIDFIDKNDFIKFCNGLEKTLLPSIGMKTKLKLICDKKRRTRLPYFCKVSKNGDAFMADNFLGDKVFISEYDEKLKNKIFSAAPTAQIPDPTSDISFLNADSKSTNITNQSNNDDILNLL